MLFTLIIPIMEHLIHQKQQVVELAKQMWVRQEISDDMLQTLAEKYKLLSMEWIDYAKIQKGIKREILDILR